MGRCLLGEYYWRMMSEQRFDEQWAQQLKKAKKKTLLWQRGSLPSEPEEITEESIVEYVRSLQPYIARANRFPLRQLNGIIRISSLSMVGGSLLCVRTPRYLKKAYVFLFLTKKMAWIYLLIFLSLQHLHGTISALFSVLAFTVNIVFIPLILDAPFNSLLKVLDRWATYLKSRYDSI